jgi:hypothetical protein
MISGENELFRFLNTNRKLTVTALIWGTIFAALVLYTRGSRFFVFFGFSISYNWIWIGKEFYKTTVEKEFFFIFMYS